MIYSDHNDTYGVALDPRMGIQPPSEYQKPVEVPAKPAPKAVTRGTIQAHVTGYNTVPGQTDSTPCIAAAGNICGRNDVVACPYDMALHTWVIIDGKHYECMDRTAKKFNGRFDISCDKDMKCPYTVTGWKEVTILD